MMARTSRIWINPDSVYELTIPSNQRTKRITAIVQSISFPPLVRRFRSSRMELKGNIKRAKVKQV